MADKKISQLTERVTNVLGTDLLPIVGNVATTPTNYKVQIKNFLSGLLVDLPQTTLSAFSLTANVTANATSATLQAAELALIANSSIGVTVRDRIGLSVRNEIQNGTSNVTGRSAAAAFTLDMGASNFAAANTYGVLVQHLAAYGVRAVAPRAYIGIRENANTAGAKTTYLFDIGAQGDTVSGANTAITTNTVLSQTSDKTANRALRINVNGEDLWILCTNSAPS